MSNRRKFYLTSLLSPGVFWLIIFFIFPSLLIVAYSFLERRDGGGVIWQFSLDAYIKLFSPTGGAVINDFMLIFFRSFWWATLTTILCLLVGYPLSFYMSRQSRSTANMLLFLVMIPFWTNFLVRTYAWKFILNNNGLINSMLQAMELPRIALINTPTAVIIGLVYGSLPFMVLPLYASMERFDFSLVEAGQDLGANYWQVFTRVYLPLTMPGVIAGCILVFIPVVGQYIVPTILGGGKVAMLGNILAQQFGSALNWPFGSAIAVVFMILLMFGIIIQFRLQREEEEV
ncbi:ABC transporter permease [Anaerolineales bacterium HSG24]|nr:ABC transporter permease [Anaerolineales bacterium HSG24]